MHKPYIVKIMDILKELLLVSIPAIVVLITAYLMIKKTIENDKDRRRSEIILANTSTITPIRLQAYERLVLLLERISVESLVMRLAKAGMDSKKLHSSLLTTIRAEFDHNLSQQVYITPQAWEVLKNAKTNTIKLINSAAEKIPPDSSATDLSKFLLETVMEMDKEPTRVAIDFLKAEVSRMM
ncbi:MAG TPA: hypothetical protein VMW76_07480 [Bacteroidales bacterium]|nr:hypothetical protein [Bacteroidales bacterium]